MCGKAKHGAGFGYTKRLCYHPLLATLAATGELLHVRMRKGTANTQRGTKRFVEELVARLRRACAAGELIMRFDSGFWSHTTIATLERLDVGYTMGVRMVKSVLSTIATIDEDAWTPIEYTPEGMAEVAEWDYKGRRLIVRRTRLVGAQVTLWPEWRHFAFVTDLQGDAVDVDAFHRSHARVELAIRDLKEGAGLEHVPSGNFSANAACLLCAALAQNLIRWSALLGELTPEDQLVVARTVRTRYLSIPGRLISRSGRPLLLRAPLAWPWASDQVRQVAGLKAYRQRLPVHRRDSAGRSQQQIVEAVVPVNGREPPGRAPRKSAMTSAASYRVRRSSSVSSGPSFKSTGERSGDQIGRESAWLNIRAHCTRGLPQRLDPAPGPVGASQVASRRGHRINADPQFGRFRSNPRGPPAIVARLCTT